MASKDTDYELLRSVLTLTVEQRAAIGCVAIEAAYLEQEAALIAWGLLGTDNESGHQVTAPLSLSARLNLILALAGTRLKDDGFSAFKAQMKTIQAVVTNRNTVIHGNWTSSSEDFFELMRKGPDAFPPATGTNYTKNGNRSITADQIMSVAAALAEARTALVILIDETLSQVRP